MIPRPGALTARPGGPVDEVATLARRTRAGTAIAARPLVAKRGTSVVPGIAMPPAFRRAELVLARQDLLQVGSRQVGSRQVRVPQDAFVPIGLRLPPPPSAPRSMLGRPGANDNAVSVRSARSRPLLREILLLLALAATLAGTYWIGRMNATQNVIVVPGPSSYRSVVT